MPERKATYLRKLKVQRVDVVHAGANQHARILIHKSADYACPTCEPVEKALENLKPAAGKKCPACGRVMPTAEKTSKGAEMSDTDLTALKEAIDAAVAAAVDPLQAQIDTFTTEKADFEKAVAEAKADPDQIDKAALPEPVRKRLEEAEAVAKAASDRVAKMEDDADSARWTETAKGLDLVAVAKATEGDAVADVAGLLKAVNKGAGAEAADYLASLLRTNQKRMAESKLLAEAGSDSTATGDADGALEKAAAELMKADSSLTLPQAIAKAADAHPDLAVASQNEVWTHA